MYGRYDVGIHPREPLQDLLQASRNHCSSLEDHIQHLAKVGGAQCVRIGCVCWIVVSTRWFRFVLCLYTCLFVWRYSALSMLQRLSALKSHVTGRVVGGGGASGSGSSTIASDSQTKSVSYVDILDNK